MTFFSDFARRLKRSDFLEFSIALFALLIVSMLFSWPADNYQENNGFFTVSALRTSLLCLLALFYGSSSTSKAKREKYFDLLAIVFLALISIPLEISSYSLSQPAPPIYWTLILALVDSIAYYAIGLVLAQILDYLHLKFLSLIAVGGSFSALFALDLKLGLALASPLSAISKPSISHLIVMLILALLGLGSLLKNDSIQPQTN